MQTSLQIHSSNRQATREETEHVANVLRSFGNNTLAKLVESSISLDMKDFQPVVVNDFYSVDDDALILLVPPGNYTLPTHLLDKTSRYIIGLERGRENYPVLIIEGQEQDIYNTDTLERYPLRVCRSYASLSAVAIEAHEPTVLETNLGHEKQFSEMYFQVEWRNNIDALDIASMVFCHGRDWAVAAYGSSYRKRNDIERGLDAVHEGVMNVIDSTFRPLVSLGKKLDQMLKL